MVEFDGMLLSPARMGIIAALIQGEALSFMELKRVTGLADGNLHVQSRKLAASGYIEITKGQGVGRSRTRFQLTLTGLHAMELHIRKLEAILDTRGAMVRLRRRLPRADDSQVWS